MKDEYRYKINSTGSSSIKYGNCEVCKKSVTEVFMQSEEKRFVYNNQEYWAKQNNIFGHKECLINKRR